MAHSFPFPVGFLGARQPLLVLRTPRASSARPERDDEPTIRVAPPRAGAGPRASGATRFAAVLGAMLRAIQTRRVLAGLDDRMLRDIGASRADALAEAARWPWDLRREAGR